MRRKGLAPMPDEHVNVTPLIDVVMCLIVFFLMCASLVRNEANDKVVVPRAELGQQLDAARDHVVINIIPHAGTTTEPDISIRGNLVSINNLTAYLRREKLDAPDFKVILRADENVPYNWISPVLVCCFNANIHSIHFSTRHP